MAHELAGHAVQISNVGSHPATPGGTGFWTLSLLVIGLLFVAGDLSGVVRSRRWQRDAVRVAGLVIDNLPASVRGRGGWRSLVEFEASGRRVVTALTGPPDPVARPLNGPIEIMYHPSDPRRVEPAGSIRSFSVWLVAGVALIVLAVVL